MSGSQQLYFRICSRFNHLWVLTSPRSARPALPSCQVMPCLAAPAPRESMSSHFIPFVQEFPARRGGQDGKPENKKVQQGPSSKNAIRNHHISSLSTGKFAAGMPARREKTRATQYNMNLVPKADTRPRRPTPPVPDRNHVPIPHGVLFPFQHHQPILAPRRGHSAAQGQETDRHRPEWGSDAGIGARGAELFAWQAVSRCPAAVALWRRTAAVRERTHPPPWRTLQRAATYFFLWGGPPGPRPTPRSAWS